LLSCGGEPLKRSVGQRLSETEMKILLLLLVSILPGGVAQETSSGANRVEWGNIRGQYEDFAQIKPNLVNNTGHSVYLGRLYPDPFPRLMRLEEGSGIWELGEWSIRCGNVDKPMEPIEIKSGETFPLSVSWQLSMDDWDHPQFFVTKDSETKRPLKGKYRLVLSYALTPWTLIHHPKQVYKIESPEFQVVP
jgi:hypothetical protein